MRSKMLGTKVINALYFILVYCICFEEVLGKMKFSLTNIKYLVAVILFCVVYRVSHPSFRQLKYTNGMKYFSIILFVAFLVSIPGFVLIDCDGLKIWKQYLWFPLFIYLFSQVERVSNLTVPLLINTFVKGTITHLERLSYLLGETNRGISYNRYSTFMFCNTIVTFLSFGSVFNNS